MKLLKSHQKGSVNSDHFVSVDLSILFRSDTATCHHCTMSSVEDQHTASMKRVYLRKPVSLDGESETKKEKSDQIDWHLEDKVTMWSNFVRNIQYTLHHSLHHNTVYYCILVVHQ